MNNFFDPTRSSEIVVPMYGSIHMITLLTLPIIVLILLWKKDAVRRIVANRKIVIGFMIGFLALELLSLILLWSYKFEPAYERFPLHLCYSLTILVPILILKKNYTWLKFFSYWAIGSGFIAFANPSFGYTYPWSFDFFHFLFRHYFLLFIPIIFTIGVGYKHTYRGFLISLTTLAGYAFLIFLLDWATGANYMHLGKNNALEIPFLPASFTVWPWVYPSFLGTGMVLLHIAYFGLSRLGRSAK